MIAQINAGVVVFQIHYTRVQSIYRHLNKIMKQIKGSIQLEIQNTLSEHGIKNIDVGKNIITISAINRIIEGFILHESKQVNQGHKITIELLEHATCLQQFKTNLFQKNID